MARRRSFDVFSMSFLDTVCCAFGAVILLYMIINASAGRDFQDSTLDQRAEVDLLEERVLEGYKNLVVLRNSLDRAEDETPPEGLAAKILEETERLKQQLADADKET